MLLNRAFGELLNVTEMSFITFYIKITSLSFKSFKSSTLRAFTSRDFLARTNPPLGTLSTGSSHVACKAIIK